MAERTCSVDGCGEKHCARGLCRLHWQRAKADGTLHQHAPSPPSTPGAVLGQVALEHGIPVPAVLGRDRDTAVQTARVDAAHQLADLGLTNAEIGKALGGRHAETARAWRREPRPDTPADPPSLPEDGTCHVDGCDRPLNTHQYIGLCAGHRMRWVRHGDIQADRALRAVRDPGAPFLPWRVHDRAGYRNGCRCDDCRADAVRAVKRNRYAGPKTIDVTDEHLDHIARLRAAGVNVVEISRRSNVPHATLYAWVNGRVRRALRTNLDAVLAVIVPCQQCDSPALAGGRWCLAHFSVHATPRSHTGCGTDAGYTTHRRAGTTPCPACREAHAAAHRRRTEAAA